MRTVRLAIGGMLTSLLVVPVTTQVAPGAAAVPVSSAGVVSVASAPTTVRAASAATAAVTGAVRTADGVRADRKRRWQPSVGVTFNDPMRYGYRRVILAKVIRSIQNTAKGERIRIATWNFDDRPAKNALIAAKRRGVKVQVIVAGAVDNPNWHGLRRALNRNRGDKSFALSCTGGCRSRVRIMHSKFYLFSRVHRARRISMVGSSNLTTPAGNRQWNDLVTTRSDKVYAYLVRIFQQYARDKSVASPFDVKTLGDYRVWIYPVGGRNPQLSQLEKVRCKGATGRTGTNGRTKIRLSVAGWFDSYGEDIAKRLRKLWDRGCDVRVVTTLAGRGINRALKAGYGRGPVPQRELSWDPNFDGIPERYLHQKSLAISGVYAGDTSASVVFTGSPNWSARAARSEEVWMRVVDRRAMTRRYMTRVDRMFFSPYSSARSTTRADLQRALEVQARTNGLTGQVRVPDWLELD